MRSFKVYLCISLLLVMWVTPTSVFTQGNTSCPAIVEIALASADSVCGNIERNQICYGNARIEAQPRTTVVDFQFETVGDVANIVDIESLALSGMNEEMGEWGVAILRAQANAPNTLPGQEITFVLFGDVEIHHSSLESVELTVTATNNINVRSGPSETESVVGTLMMQESIVADGRLPDMSWLRVHWAGGLGGWVQASQVQAEGDLATLSAVMPDALMIPGGAGQIFYFRSGIGDAPCQEAPESGLMVQTPEGVNTIDLLINEVHFTLGSTAYLQARPGEEMIVHMLEGQSWVESLGVRSVALAGTQVRIPINLNWAAIGQPSLPEPYDLASFSQLPLTLLDRDIELADPLTELEIALALDNPLADILPDGRCTALAAPDNVDLYAGPSTVYDIEGSLVAWDITYPDQLLIDMEGNSWWHLPSGYWIQAEAVLTAGACDDLPVTDNSSS